MATASGTPRPSAKVERFTPSLPRSVGFFPVFFPAQRSLGHRSVHALPAPLDALQFVVLAKSPRPELLEDSVLRPFLKVGVDGAAGAELTRHGFPLTAGAKDVEDAGHDLPQFEAGPASFTTRFVNGEQRLDTFPE